MKHNCSNGSPTLDGWFLHRSRSKKLRWFYDILDSRDPDYDPLILLVIAAFVLAIVYSA